MIHTREIGGVRISCWTSETDFTSDRRSLFFIHGSGGDHTAWNGQIASFRDRFNVVAVDLPGHGQSGGGGEETVEAYVAWVRDTLAAFKLPKPVLVGHSLGAAISLTMALNHGEEIAGIVPVGGGIRMPVNPAILAGLESNPGPILTMAAQIVVAKRNRERLSHQLLEGPSAVNPRVMRGDFLACDRLDLTGTVGRIAVPSLVICGAEDKMTPPALSQAIAEKIPGAHLALIEGTGHMVMLEDPAAFNNALAGFLSAL